MNRDAKIGIVVILLIVGLLVIIWGREPGDDSADAELAGADKTTDTGPIANSIDMRPTGAGSSMDRAILAVSPSEGARVVPSIEIADARPFVTEPPVEAATVEPTATPPPIPAPKNWKYTVVGGDTLIYIARDQLGNEKRWPEIAKLNNLVKPYALRVGQKLTMPPKDAGAAAAVTVEPAPVAPVASGNFRKYTVQDGDSLTLIAREQLSDGTLWKKIAELNRLAKPYNLKPGQVILLPE